MKCILIFCSNSQELTWTCPASNTKRNKSNDKDTAAQNASKLQTAISTTHHHFPCAAHGNRLYDAYNGIEHFRGGTGAFAPFDRPLFSCALGSVTCSFKRELKAYESYELWTRILSWDEKWIYLITHFVRAGAVQPKEHTLYPEQNPNQRGLTESEGEKLAEQKASSDALSCHPGVVATALSKCVFKNGRRTVSPVFMLKKSGILPPTCQDKPIPTSDSTESSQFSESCKSSDSGIAVGNDEEECNMDRIEEERARGMESARPLANDALSILELEFTGEKGPVLGKHVDGHGAKQYIKIVITETTACGKPSLKIRGSTKITFEIASKDLLRKLRDFLRSNGLFVFKQVRIPIVNELYKVVIEEMKHEWTNEEIRDQINDAHDLSSKMYDDKFKYGGSQDSFDFQLTIFYDLYTKAGFNSDTYSSSFSTMLRDDALDYYYDLINNQGLPFNITCSMIQSHFETEEHKQAMMPTWNSIDEKSLFDCFKILLKSLKHIQRGLSSESRSGKYIRDKLINACNNIEACAYACLKSSSSLVGLCGDLRSSAITFNWIRKTDHLSSNQNFYPVRIYRSANHKSRSQPSKITFKKKCFQSGNKNSDRRVHQYVSEFEDFEQDNFSPEKTYLDSNEEDL
ncbi:hypothetical protein EPUL_003177 [Erysiphe pulchra]|uniref:Uncharacterized protein n=1 Tax=Erysiphe pulchra TaxID=225359 RepID=A0A2S4PU11_9PEZI|nr:hypothetical protein EPUL_003177 [Erysiphe pulchra]